MRNLIQTLLKKENKRRLLSALFLIFFLGEIGSHVVICGNLVSNDDQSVYSQEGGHDDPCKFLVLCSDSGRKDKQIPNLGHDASQHNALFDRRPDLVVYVAVQKDPTIPFATGNRLFRPPSPTFHPPEIY